MGRSRVVVSTSLVVSYLLDREASLSGAPTPSSQCAPVAGGFILHLYLHSCNLKAAKDLLKKYREKSSKK